MKSLPSKNHLQGEATCKALHGCSYGSHQVFTCGRCGKSVCYCQGASDDHPDLCAECANKEFNGTQEQTQA